jgi:KDO2-lipid IV(A) lauroyltransferase
LPGERKDWKQDLVWRLEAIGFQALFGFLRLLGVEGASGLGG